MYLTFTVVFIEAAGVGSHTHTHTVQGRWRGGEKDRDTEQSRLDSSGTGIQI